MNLHVVKSVALPSWSSLLWRFWHCLLRQARISQRCNTANELDDDFLASEP